MSIHNNGGIVNSASTRADGLCESKRRKQESQSRKPETSHSLLWEAAQRILYARETRVSHECVARVLLSAAVEVGFVAEYLCSLSQDLEDWERPGFEIPWRKNLKNKKLKSKSKTADKSVRPTQPFTVGLVRWLRSHPRPAVRRPAFSIHASRCSVQRPSRGRPTDDALLPAQPVPELSTEPCSSAQT
jgi:hypothetical protein